MSSTAMIPAPLVEILDYIVDKDPEYSDRSKIVKHATWEWVKAHPLYEEFLRFVTMTDKQGSEKEAAPVEDSTATPVPAEA